MPVPIRREVGCGPMIVDITAVSRDLAVRSIAQLEGELFGRGAWNANMVREELDAPARTYLLDVLGEGRLGDIASLRRPGDILFFRSCDKVFQYFRIHKISCLLWFS